MISEAEQRQHLTGLFPFLDQDHQFAGQFFDNASLVNIQQGQHVCREGLECTHLALLVDGCARVYKLGENGKEITLYRIGKGQSCILTASCLLSHNPFPAFAQCETDIKAVVVAADQVRSWLSRHDAWRDYVFGLVAQRFSDVITVIEEVVFRRMDSRIADYLLDRTSGQLPVVKLTHQQMASDLGTSREVVSRILKDFEHRDLLKVGRGTIEATDRIRLRAIAGDRP